MDGVNGNHFVCITSRVQLFACVCVQGSSVSYPELPSVIYMCMCVQGSGVSYPKLLSMPKKNHVRRF